MFFLISCWFHTENIWTLVLYRPDLFQSVPQNYGPNILPYGPQNWLIIRAQYSQKVLKPMLLVSSQPTNQNIKLT